MPKLIVDSSIWIDFFNKKTSRQIEHLRMLLLTNAVKSPITILPVIMQEVLQGIENDRFYNAIKENLLGLGYVTYQPYDNAINAAQLYRFFEEERRYNKKSK
ncbi:MAG TPA: hypothetical protein VNS50_07255 [Ginsengibacter sp.]|nr:hypothetical protein [Ginsengibacter sp.]